MEIFPEKSDISAVGAKYNPDATRNSPEPKILSASKRLNADAVYLDSNMPSIVNSPTLYTGPRWILPEASL